MSIALIRTVLDTLPQGTDWSIQLFNNRPSKERQTLYSCRRIQLSPASLLTDLLSDISKQYAEKGKKPLTMYQEVRPYDDTADACTIYRLSADDPLIKEEYDSFLTAVGDPDAENDPFRYNSAYLLKGSLPLDGHTANIKLVSMQTPVTTLKHRYLLNQGEFKPVPQQILSLRPFIDVLIIDSTIFFLTSAGEKLFNMERSYRSICTKRVEEIAEADILSDPEEFQKIARSGFNPKRFLSFNRQKLDALLVSKEKLQKLTAQFSIPLTEDGSKIDTSKDGVSEKLVKFLCDKGMIDPVEESAVEVASARRWK